MMAKVKVLQVTCDKCGFEELDPDKFLHVVVTNISNDPKVHGTVRSERDLCIQSCVGQPGVNRDA